MLPWYASVHRGAGPASRHCTALYEQARATVAAFAGAREDDVTVFVRNTTDALTLLARSVPAGGDVVFLDAEHHANLLPWQEGPHRCVPVATTIAATLERLAAALEERPAALVAITGASNVTGERLPIADVVAIARGRGARVVVDAAQLAPHGEVDLAGWDADWVAFSGHKLYAPFGAGALIGRRDWLDAGRPHLPGGGAVLHVGEDATVWATAPERHEGGTPNLLGAVALATACEQLAALGPHALEAHDAALRGRLRAGLAALPGVRVHRIFDDATEQPPVGIVCFTVEGHTPADVSRALAARAISVRAGRFCAHRLLARLGIPNGAVRASVGVGTNLADIDALLRAMGDLAAHESRPLAGVGAVGCGSR